MNAGETIKVVRVELGLSQSEMAEKLGVNSQSISRWETGLHFPKKKIADRILKFAETADISEGSKKIIEEWLDAGRRYGVSAEDYGFPNIDQDLLCMIADTSVNAAYVIEADTYQVLYVNKATKKWALSTLEDARNKKCYEYMRKRTKPCEDCPFLQFTGDEMVELTMKNFNDNRYIRVRGVRTKWNGKEVYISYGTE